MERHCTVEKTNSKRVTHNLEEEAHLLDEYLSYCQEYLKLTGAILRWTLKWNHLRKTLHRVNFKKAQSIHSVPYRAGPKAREFEWL